MDVQVLDYRARERDRETARARQEEEDRGSNRDFVQVYPNGWKRLQELMKGNVGAARLYAFLAENIDPQCGSVVVSQELMAEMLDVSKMTIRRHTKYLEVTGAVVRIRVGNGVYAYCLNPEEVWRSWDKQKKTAAFVTKTLVRKTDEENQSVRRKLSVILREQGSLQEDLDFDPETGELHD